MVSCSRVLVTGGAGFIGSHIVQRLLDDGFEVTVLDNLVAGDPLNISRHRDKSNFKFVKGDIRNSDLTKKILKDIDAVFHEAALVDVTDSLNKPLLTNEINATGTLSLLQTCINCNVKRFIYASSCAVYGESKLPVHEGRLPHPISPYAASKMAAESYAISFYETYGLKTICLRYFNCYDDSEVHDSYSGVTKRFINQLLKNQPPIVYGDGKQTRDFVHVNDVVEANMLVLKNENVAGEVFNVGTGIATSINQLIKILQEIMAKTHLKPIYANPRRGDIRHSCANINKAERILGYKPSTLLKDGLVTLVQWYKEKGTYTERVQ